MGGETRVGEYVLETELGRGALGTVYRGRSADGRVVAIKTFDGSLAADDTFRARLAREARVASEIRDSHLVELVEIGDAGGTPFLVLEYLSGGSLAERLGGGPLTGDAMIEVVASVAAGLDVLHRAGVVHRDVKPSNILFREGGSAVLTDFGLAKGTALTVLTRRGQVLGTLDYLAPEVLRGGEATPASDLYALGCVAFECLAGRPPFGDRSLFGVGTAHIEDDPPHPPAGAELGHALLTAMEKDPARRPPTATMYAHMLVAAARR